MGVRRFTRLTNAFSKKFENHCHMVAIYHAYYNFCVSSNAEGHARDGSWYHKSHLECEELVRLLDAANLSGLISKQPTTGLAGC